MDREQAMKKIDDLSNGYFEEFGDWAAASGFRAALNKVIYEYYEPASQPTIRADGADNAPPLD